MKCTVVVGNPRPGSRTARAAIQLAGWLSAGEPDVVEVAELGAGLLGGGDPAVDAARTRVQGSDLVVVASPTFKATYSGLLKLFLDQFDGDTGLRGVVAVPLMLGAAPDHALAVEVHLKPVLVELGASCPAPGVFQLDSRWEADPVVRAWVDRWGPVLVPAMSEV